MPSDRERCRQIVSACALHGGWQLDPLTRERYVYALTPLMVAVVWQGCEDLVVNYHLDHQMVTALSQAQHPAHHEHWQRWSSQVVGMLQRSGLTWTRDGAIEVEDLAQVARAELARALPNYRYQSRFLSWAYSVVVRSVQRQIRASQARRRSAPQIPLEHLVVGEAHLPATTQHETVAYARVLASHVVHVLGAQADPRLLPLFQLWAIEGQTSAELGARFGLHESRVRALLQRARAILQRDQTIQQWNGLGDES
ncbi:MAG: sigma-70 family RNA polymerase sigma factor [Oscillochloridaceae bacterium umkhey_bin13]